MNCNAERHQRILNIVAHLGLNKKRGSIPHIRRFSNTHVSTLSPIINTFYSPEEALLTKAKKLLQKPIKRQQFKSESQVIEQISNKYDFLKEDDNENSTYNHIQRSLLMLNDQEFNNNSQQINKISQFGLSRTTYDSPLFVPQRKVKLQNLFEKKCSIHKITKPIESPLQLRCDALLRLTKESFQDFQQDINQYKNLKKQNKLIKQRSVIYFQQQ